MTLKDFSSNKYEFLSNFAACDVYYFNDIDPAGTWYKTAEHAYQAAKAQTLKDMHFIAAAPTPADAKRRARTICCRQDWDNIKKEIMLQIVRNKFTIPDMEERLLGTINDGIDDFCETNWWHDNYWGDCQCPICKDIPGQNELGKILTQVRKEIITKKQE